MRADWVYSQWLCRHSQWLYDQTSHRHFPNQTNSTVLTWLTQPHYLRWYKLVQRIIQLLAHHLPSQIPHFSPVRPPYGYIGRMLIMIILLSTVPYTVPYLNEREISDLMLKNLLGISPLEEHPKDNNYNFFNIIHLHSTNLPHKSEVVGFQYCSWIIEDILRTVAGYFTHSVVGYQSEINQIGWSRSV